MDTNWRMCPASVFAIDTPAVRVEITASGWGRMTARSLVVGTVAYASRGWFLQLVHPKGILGIPAYPNATPILGDVLKLSAWVKAHDGIAMFMDEVGRDLGIVAQLRLTAAKTNRPQQLGR